MTGRGKKRVCGILAFLMGLLLLVLAGIHITGMFSSGIYQNIRESTTANVVALTSDRARMLDKTLGLLETQARTLALHLETQENVTPDRLASFLQSWTAILSVQWCFMRMGAPSARTTL